MSVLNPTLAADDGATAVSPPAGPANCVAVIWLRQDTAGAGVDQAMNTLRATLGVCEVTLAPIPAWVLVIRYHPEEIRSAQMLDTLRHYGWEALLVGC